MSDDSPYDSPNTTSPQESRPRQNEIPRSSADDGKITRYAQLGIRLLGILFIVDGVALLVGSVVNGAMQSSALQQAGYPPMPDSYVFGWAAQSIAYILIGVYCVVGGRWVIETIFLPSSRTRNVDDGDSESSDE